MQPSSEAFRVEIKRTSDSRSVSLPSIASNRGKILSIGKCFVVAYLPMWKTILFMCLCWHTLMRVLGFPKKNPILASLYESVENHVYFLLDFAWWKVENPWSCMRCFPSLLKLHDHHWLNIAVDNTYTKLVEHARENRTFSENVTRSHYIIIRLLSGCLCCSPADCKNVFRGFSSLGASYIINL